MSSGGPASFDYLTPAVPVSPAVMTQMLITFAKSKTAMLDARS